MYNEIDFEKRKDNLLNKLIIDKYGYTILEPNLDRTYFDYHRTKQELSLFCKITLKDKTTYPIKFPLTIGLNTMINSFLMNTLKVLNFDNDKYETISNILEFNDEVIKDDKNQMLLLDILNTIKTAFENSTKDSDIQLKAKIIVPKPKALEIPSYSINQYTDLGFIDTNNKETDFRLLVLDKVKPIKEKGTLQSKLTIDDIN